MLHERGEETDTETAQTTDVEVRSGGRGCALRRSHACLLIVGFVGIAVLTTAVIADSVVDMRSSLDGFLSGALRWFGDGAQSSTHSVQQVSMASSTEELWPQILSDHTQCLDWYSLPNIERYVGSQEMCQSRAKASGHDFYQFWALGESCATMALCDKPLSGTASTWRIFHQASNLSIISSIVPPRSLFPMGRNVSTNYGELVKLAAVEEAHLTFGNISFYGASVPKVPLWIVSNVSALKEMYSTKVSRFNFQGSLAPSNKKKHNSLSDKERRREWVVDFAQEHFANDDVLIITDAPANHTPYGPYDQTRSFNGFRVKENATDKPGDPTFDATYFRNMVQSTFTLCPGGDKTWSMRFYESIMAGSIPVIYSERKDFGYFSVGYWFRSLGYKYFIFDQVASWNMTSSELQSIVDENYKIFLLYQTFTYGDQVPGAYARYNGPCSAYEVCRSCYEAFTNRTCKKARNGSRVA